MKAIAEHIFEGGKDKFDEKQAEFCIYKLYQFGIKRRFRLVWLTTSDLLISVKDFW